jgi:hypothetical protein
VLKPLSHDSTQVRVRKFKHRATADVQGELFEFGEARSRELVGQRAGGEAKVAAQPRGQLLQETRGLRTAG